MSFKFSLPDKRAMRVIEVSAGDSSDSFERQYKDTEFLPEVIAWGT